MLNIGETSRSNRAAKKKAFTVCEVQPDRLIAAWKNFAGYREKTFAALAKVPAIRAKEMLILIGLQMGVSMKVLSEIIGISPSALSRRHDAVRRTVREEANISKLASEIIQQYMSLSGE